MPPAREVYTAREWALVRRLRTPHQVQAWLRSLPYNHERDGETLRSFRAVVRAGSAHCLEAAIAAAAILEHHGYRPRILVLDSQDDLQHTVFVFRRRGPRTASVRGGRWGAVARSRDLGLHGRRPLFRSLRALALSYADPFVDFTGRITGFATANLGEFGSDDWRFSLRNCWKLDRWLDTLPLAPLAISERRYRRLLVRYRELKARRPDAQPDYYRGTERWM